MRSNSHSRNYIRGDSAIWIFATCGHRSTVSPPVTSALVYFESLSNLATMLTKGDIDRKRSRRCRRFYKFGILIIHFCSPIRLMAPCILALRGAWLKPLRRFWASYRNRGTKETWRACNSNHLPACSLPPVGSTHTASFPPHKRRTKVAILRRRAPCIDPIINPS